jgi:hypothetical protein
MLYVNMVIVPRISSSWSPFRSVMAASKAFQNCVRDLCRLSLSMFLFLSLSNTSYAFGWIFTA